MMVTAATNNPEYLLYDGHGSVRQLAHSSGSVVENYSFDAYGNAIGFDPASVSTVMLYTGERWDNHLKALDLRTRDYDPVTGRFLTQDTYPGSNQDPISLHKYLYAHANPTNNIDPTGRFALADILSAGSIRNIISSAQTDVYQAAELSARTIRSRGSIYQAVGITLAANVAPFVIGPMVDVFADVVDDLFASLVRRLGNKIRIQGRVLAGVSDELAELYLRRTARDKYGAEAIGEIGASWVAQAQGFTRVKFQKLASGHGIDQIWRKGRAYVIVEAKGGTGKLASGQMSRRWIRGNIAKLKLKDRDLARKLEGAINSRRIKGMVVRTKTKGPSAFTPRFVLKGWDEIGKLTWSGRGG